MLGLIKKDFLLIKANLKSLSIIFIVFIVMMFQGSFDVAFVMPLLGIMMFISTFSYDDFNHWNSYAITFPNARKNIVSAKYVASLILIIFLGLASFFLSMGISFMKTNTILLEEIIHSLMGTILSSIFIISLLYPIVFKYGSTNGRIILFAFIFGIVGIFGIISNFVDMTYVINIINGFDAYSYIAIPIVSILLLGISYFISDKIFQKKEF